MSVFPMIDRWMVLAAAVLAAAVEPARAIEPAPPSQGLGRVLEVEHSGATRSFVPQAGPVQELVRAGLTRFTGLDTTRAAWLSLVSTQDTVGLKVHSAPGAASGTRGVVVAALIETLLEAGVPASQIVIWDKRLIDLRLAGFYELAAKYQVRVAGAVDTGFDAQAKYDSSLLGKLVYGDLEFGKRGEGVGRASHVTTLLTKEITKIVSVTPLLNHNLAGVSGVLHGLALSSVDNTLRFEEPERLSSAIPEIVALPEIGDRLVLNIVDALLCQYRGEERTLLHYSTPLNQLWFSKDPVAVDVLANAELDRQNKDRKLSRSTQAIYENAALLDLGVADPKRIKTERFVVN